MNLPAPRSASSLSGVIPSRDPAVAGDLAGKTDWRKVLVGVSAGLFLLAYLWLGVIGTGTRIHYQLPALGLLGLCLVVGFLPARPSAFAWSRLALVSVVALGGYILIRATSSPIPYSARKDSLLLLGCAAVYLVFLFILHGTAWRKAMVFLLGLLGLANTGVALYQRVFDPNFHVYHAHDPSRPIPGSGLYFNYDHMAGFTELVALLCLSVAILGNGSRRERLAFGSLGLIACIGVLVSMSRGGFLSLGAGLVALSAFSWIASRHFGWSPLARRGILVVAMLAMLGFLGAGLTLIGTRFEGSAARESGTGLFQIGISNRLENWSLAKRQWKLDPVVGTGSGTYDEYSIRLWREDWHRPDIIFHPIHAHNDYLQMLAEYGLVGLALALAALAVHLFYGYSGFRGWMRSGNGRDPIAGNTRMALVAGSLCCLVAYGVHSTLDFNMRLLASASVIAFCLAVLASAGPRRKDPALPEASAMTGRVLGGLIGVVLLLAVARFARPEYHYEKLRSALDADEIGNALAHGASAEKLEKKNHILYRLLGYARMRYADEFPVPSLRDGFLQTAVEAFRSGVALNPGDSHANVLLGRTLEKTGDAEGAELAFRNGLDWDPYGGDTNGAYGDFNLKRGVELLDQGRLDEAIALLAKALPRIELRVYSTPTPLPANQDILVQCHDALHEAYSARAKALDDEADRLTTAGRDAPARQNYLEAMAAYRESLNYKPTDSPDADFEVRRYNELFETYGRGTGH